MTKLIVLDTETTGLDPYRHDIWEVACVVVNGGREKCYVWQLPVDLSKADLIALNIGKFNERYNPKALTSLAEFSSFFMNLTWGATIVGAVPSFDCERLGLLLRLQGFVPGWHYHLIDIEALAIGFLRGKDPKLEIPIPYSTDWVAEKLGVERSVKGRHTALGDAKEVLLWWKIIMGGVE